MDEFENQSEERPESRRMKMIKEMAEQIMQMADAEEPKAEASPALDMPAPEKESPSF